MWFSTICGNFQQIISVVWFNVIFHSHKYSFIMKVYCVIWISLRDSFKTSLSLSTCQGFWSFYGWPFISFMFSMAMFIDRTGEILCPSLICGWVGGWDGKALPFIFWNETTIEVAKFFLLLSANLESVLS